MYRELTPKAQAILEENYHRKIKELNEYMRTATKPENIEWALKERHYYILKLRRARKGYTFE